MILNMSGGGGSDLNYRVMASTSAPANPKANDIWIKSSTAVYYYRFCSNTPSGTNSNTGNVYIVCSTSSDKTTDNTVPVLNILNKKENGQTIRCLLNLTGCYQVINGEWQTVDAYLYKGGAWLQFSEIITNLYLYNLGDTCDSVTGGWTKYNSNSTVTNGSNSMTVKANGNYEAGGAKTVNTIDVTNFNTLVFTGSNGSGTSYSDFAIRLTKDGTVKASMTSAKNATLDVSGLSGAHTVEVYCNNAASGGRSIIVSEIYLTK